MIPHALLAELHNAQDAQHPLAQPRGDQPVHVLYGGAHLFQPDTFAKMGALALKALSQDAPEFITFGRAMGLLASDEGPSTPEDIHLVAKRFARLGAQAKAQSPSLWLAHAVYERVVEKLTRAPVEDLRLDFEDGYGPRADAEEDATAREAARRLAEAWRVAEGKLPRVGIRIKPFTRESVERSAKTLDLFLGALLEATGKQLPEGFVVTLPKVTLPQEARLLSGLLDDLEARHSLERGAVKVELMVESPRALVGQRGELHLPELVRAAQGRCVAVHLGAYDYAAACGVVAAHQSLTHPLCDSARAMMKLSLTDTGVWLSDGATNLIPLGPHRVAEPSFNQRAENRAKVHAAWRLHYGHVRRALGEGWYQGWDLHPAQLPARYGAVFAFFLENVEAMSERLRSFLDKAAQASLLGSVFDDAATGQGLLEFFARGVACGALTQDDLVGAGLRPGELQTRSFAKLLEGRKGAA